MPGRGNKPVEIIPTFMEHSDQVLPENKETNNDDDDCQPYDDEGNRDNGDDGVNDEIPVRSNEPMEIIPPFMEYLDQVLPENKETNDDDENDDDCQPPKKFSNFLGTNFLQVDWFTSVVVLTIATGH
eukprot:CAMPEP_0176175882 /NCGR_PEP_ID=MMETSP0120_2-20121206/90099_1 /TAXON_ID=160619 /ORGANISM="Kryptoperidinium foliaceum, Strain CCMP 1326" /LENGTH=126 /DNA_ID=CAMNT_0017513931 /DNA_START=1011 /DNA_END=1391 /DNA_ORIENTATION=+